MQVENLDELVNKYVDQPKKSVSDNPLAPVHPFRMVVNAPSGAGKTNLVGNLLLNYLNFDRIYIFAPDLEEPKYQFLISFFKAIEQKYQEENDEEIQLIWFGDKPEDIPEVNELDPEYTNVVIVDDAVLNRKANEKISELFIRGRKRNCSIIYQCQSFFSLPKVIRLQANYIILFGVGSMNEMREIAKNFAAQIDFDEFKKLYRECTSQAFDFLLIDMKTTKAPMKIRSGFDGLYVQPKTTQESVKDAETGKELARPKEAPAEKPKH